MSNGSNAFFSVDGIAMESDKNSASGFISGVTLDFNAASMDETVKVEIERDIGGITDKVQELFDSYNSVVRFSKDSTYRGDPNDNKDQDGTLAGDSTVRSMVNQLGRVFHQQFDLVGSKYPSLSMLGIKTNTNTGEMEIDRDKFEEALENDFDDVMKVFTTVGYSENSNVSLGRYTEETQSGSYILEEVDANTMRIRLEGESTWYTSEARTGDVITFDDGPAKDLSITAVAGSLTEATSFTFSKGFAEQIKEIGDKLTDSDEGMIALRQKTMRDGIDRSEDRIMRLEDRVEKYRERLVKQFSAMEQAISSMQSQSSNMMNALGSYA
ncbi:MAG: flagellar filament capping protein FliD [Chitinivibrionales bacterium]